jgi:hypothetical protein
MNDAIDRYGGADEELVPSDFEGGHLLNRCHIQQRMGGSMPALFQVQQ